MTGAIKFLRRHQVTVVALSLILVLGATVFWTWSQGREDPRIQVIKNKGYPTTLRDLTAWYPEVPAESNAALICLQAFALPVYPGNTNANSELAEKDWLPEAGERLSDKDEHDLALYVKQAEPVLKLLHSLPAEPKGRYPIDFSAGFACLLPHLGKFKGAIRILGAEAVLHSSRGETESAVESLVAASRVTQTLATEPILISHLVRIACNSIVTRHIEGLVNAHRLEVPQLIELREALRMADDGHGLQRALAGERVFGLTALYDRREAQAVLFGTGGAPGRPDWKSWAAISALKASGLLSKDRGYYLDRMEQYLEAAEAPYPKRFELGKLASTNVAPSRLLIFSRMLLPALGQTTTRDAENTARLRTAQTALEMEIYLRTHGERLPATLDEALDATKQITAEDPFTGQRLHYKRLSGGYVIYSVGSDGVDHGGEAPAKAKSGPGRLPAKDIRFAVEREYKTGVPGERSAGE